MANEMKNRKIITPRAKRASCLILIISAFVVILFPAWSPFVSLPHNSLRLEARTHDVQVIYDHIVLYRWAHGGQNPPSLELLTKDPVGSDDATRSAKCVYCPGALHDEPLVASYDPPIAVWVTTDGDLYLARMQMCGILWPRWQKLEKSTRVRFW